MLLVNDRLFKEPFIPIKISLKLTMFLFLEKYAQHRSSDIDGVHSHLHIIDNLKLCHCINILKISEAARLLAVTTSATSNFQKAALM